MATRVQDQGWGRSGSNWGSILPSRPFSGAEVVQTTTDEKLEMLVETMVRQIARALKEKFSQDELYFTPGGTITFPMSGSVVPVLQIPPTEPLTLAKELTELRERLKALEDLVSNLSSTLSPIQERVVVLRSITREEAKSEIIKLFQKGGVHDYGEIAETLQIDLPLVVDICNELEKEGHIGEPD